MTEINSSTEGKTHKLEEKPQALKHVKNSHRQAEQNKGPFYNSILSGKSDSSEETSS